MTTKREIVDAIITASDAMPDEGKHQVWLLGLSEPVLRDRLRIIESERTKNMYRRRDYGYRNQITAARNGSLAGAGETEPTAAAA